MSELRKIYSEKNMKTLDEMSLICKLEDISNTIGYLSYWDDSSETEWQIKHRKLLEDNEDDFSTVGWYMLSTAVPENSEFLVMWNDSYTLLNVYRDFSRIAPILKEHGYKTVSTDLDEAYYELLSLAKRIFT